MSLINYYIRRWAEAGFRLWICIRWDLIAVCRSVTDFLNFHFVSMRWILCTLFLTVLLFGQSNISIPHPFLFSEQRLELFWSRFDSRCCFECRISWNWSTLILSSIQVCSSNYLWFWTSTHMGHRSVMFGSGCTMAKRVFMALLFALYWCCFFWSFRF